MDEAGAFGLLFPCENAAVGCAGTVFMSPEEATRLNLVVAAGEAGVTLRAYNEISADVAKQILATKSPRVKARLLSQWNRMARQQMQMGNLIAQRGAASAVQVNVQANAILPGGPIDRYMKSREGKGAAVIDIDPDSETKPDDMAGLGG